jgi:hypothetical protein
MAVIKLYGRERELGLLRRLREPFLAVVQTSLLKKLVSKSLKTPRQFHLVKERFKRVDAERLSGSPPEALDREVELPLAPNDYEGEEDGIKFVPLWRWLLE